MAITPIPIVWRIDVEPDAFQPGHGLPPWTGFVEVVSLVDRLRAPLQDLCGADVHPTWFLRLDPDVAHWYGQSDYVVRSYPALIDRLRAAGDAFGIHVHFYRWDEEQQVGFSDHADDAWLRECVDEAIGTFTRCFGHRPRISSQGGFMLNDAVANRLIHCGVEADVTPEPGLPPQATGATFGAYTTAPSADFTGVPRFPYYPSRHALASPAATRQDARQLLLVPLTAYDYERALAPLSIRAAKALLRWPDRYRPLSPYKAWPSPGTYWDLLERAADEGPARYLALAMRTDSPDAFTFRRVKAIFDHLPQHPIARRLEFVDPLSPAIAALARPRNPTMPQHAPGAG